MIIVIVVFNFLLSGHVFVELTPEPSGKLFPNIFYTCERRNFPGIDAFMLVGDELWMFQHTVSQSHTYNNGGRIIVEDGFSEQKIKQRHLVFVTLGKKEEEQKGIEFKFPNVPRDIQRWLMVLPFENSLTHEYDTGVDYYPDIDISALPSINLPARSSGRIKQSQSPKKQTAKKPKSQKKQPNSKRAKK